jgi:uncharacterized protein (TIGR00730 family)
MLCEYLEPLERLNRHDVQDTIVMFGSSQAKPEKEIRAKLRRARNTRETEQLRQALELSRYYEDAVELSAKLTRWAESLGPGNRFVIASGGGPGIMEAANRGATERANGLSVGLAISIPLEERPNRFITPELCFEFHYFFMRKFWFIYMSSAIVIFPGGFGTLDELFEVLTLLYTKKITRPIPLVLYGRKYWNEIINFDAMMKWGVIPQRARGLFKVCDTPTEAFTHLKRRLLRHYRRRTPRSEL